MRDLPVIRTLLRPSAIPSAALLAIDDPAHDLRLDEKTRQFYRARYATLPASLVFVPLVAGGAWIGFIHAMYNQRSRLADDEIRRLEVLAGQAAVAAQSLRQLEQIQKRAQYEYLTREIGGQISSTIERDTILRTTARSLAQALEASHVIIEIVAPGLIGQIPVEADQPARPSQLSHLSESARRKAARQSETARRKPAPSSIDERPLRPLVPERAETAQTRAQLSSRSEPSNTPQQNMLLYSYSRHAASATAPSGEETAEDEFLITSFRTGVEQPNDPRSLLKDLSPGYMYVPILLRGELIGSIQVYDVNQNREWSEEDQTLLNTVSSQSALALDNARLFQETQTALSETETLYQAGARLNAAQSFDEILQTLGQYTMLGQADKLLTLTLFNRPWGSSPDTEDAALGALLPSSSEWKTEFAGIPEWNTAIASTTTLPPENLRHRYALREFPAVRLLSPTEPLIVSDISTDPRLDKESRRLYQDNFQGSSAIIAPLYVGGLWIGTIMGVFGQSQTFNEGQVRRLMALAGQAAVAVQNLQSVELAEQRAREAQQRSEELALVNRIIAAVSAASDLQSSLDTMAEELGKALGLQNGIALFDEGRQSLTLVAAYNLDSSPVSPTKDGVESAELLPSDLLGIRIPVEGNLSTQKVIETHRTLLIEDVANNPLTAEIKQMLSERGVHSMAILPLMAGTQMIGTVGLDILEIGRKLTPEEIRLAETIVFQTGTTIQNARLFEQTQQVLAETDTLYQASTEFNLAKDYAQIINTLYTHTVLGQGTPPLQAHNLSLVVFDRPWVGENMPEWAIPLARHGDPTVASFSDRYLLSAFPAARTLMGPDRITVIENLDTDPRLDHNTRRLYTQSFKAKSAIFAPLVVGGQWIGYLNAMYPESMQPAQISEKELRRVTILAGQSAVAVQNIRLLEESRRRAGQLQTAAEIARDTSGTLALDSLLQRSVSLLRERFGYYHASVFLIDEVEYMAVLAESTGEAGEEMKRRQHKLAVGSRSVIGQVTSEGMPVVLNDVTTEEARSIHKPNPLLPNTKAELGIPLKIADRVIGALDVQSAQANAFSTDEIAVLQILSDQIAVAVETARTYELVQKAAEELREADRLKSQFLANMSHELRTPLNSIIGFSRVILKGIDGPISDLQQQDLNAIYNSGQHLLGLINDVLDLSKIEAGKMELSFEDNINLTDIIKGVLSTTMGLLKDKPVQLHQEVEPHLPLLRIDAMKVRQVLINLLSNASKFTEEGSITVRATTQTAQSGSREVLVEVIDTGPGIALEDQEKLFKPFSQVDGSLTRKTGGSGLGLSICDHLIRMHGGKVSLTSEVGKGSIFYFTLPVPPEKAIESEPIQDHAPHQSPEPSHGVAAAQQTAPAAEKQPQQNQSAPEKIETLTEPLARQPRQRTEPSTTSEQKQPQEEPPVKLPPDLQDQDKSLETIKNAGLIILTIDQDHQVTDMYRRYLANHNCTAIALTELGQAATVAKGIQPNMITLDVAMRSKKVLPPGEKGIPDPDGWQVLEELKSDPGTRNIPVIVCSLLDDPAVRERAKNLGADEYLLKPILEEDLMGTIQRLYFSARSGSGTRQRKEQS